MRRKYILSSLGCKRLCIYRFAICRFFVFAFATKIYKFWRLADPGGLGGTPTSDLSFCYKNLDFCSESGA